ncbi:MAG TPA: sialidase family protein, partial [Actinomycetota bacterium]|nr:sialidase family protein [Actinomycetota bacterium]
MRRVSILLTAASVFALMSGIIQATPALAASIKISSDPFTNSTSQHMTQVEPDSFAFGQTIVAAVQSGRFFDGGASDVGFSTSKDAGATWTPGFLPGTTPFSSPPGPYQRVSDPSVAYDPKHNVWVILTLGLKANANDVIVNRSTDGGLTFQNPVVVAVGSSVTFYDKTWITCDTTSTSPFFGNCYAQWDDAGSGNLMLMSTSTDGGLTWGAPKSTANNERGTIGGNPVVLGSGKVVVPFLGNFGIEAFNSTDGGNSWSTPVHVATVSYHGPAGGIRAPLPGPTAELVEPGGTQVFVAWSDCRFES